MNHENETIGYEAWRNINRLAEWERRKSGILHDYCTISNEVHRPMAEYVDDAMPVKRFAAALMSLVIFWALVLGGLLVLTL